MTNDKIQMTKEIQNPNQQKAAKNAKSGGWILRIAALLLIGCGVGAAWAQPLGFAGYLNGKYVPTLTTNGALIWPTNFFQANSNALNQVVHSVPTIYVTDPQFGAVGDYTGGLTTIGSGTDNRARIQAALDYAYTQGAGGFADELNGTSYRVVVPRGKYYISARSDGLESLSVPLGVQLDLSEGGLYFEPPPTNNFGNGILEPNPLWCGILLGDPRDLVIGDIVMIARDLTYGGTWFGASLDAIRVQESGLSWIRGGGGRHRIMGFTRGAGIRYLASYNAYVSDVDFGNCAYGVIMSYLGSAYSGYTRYRAVNDADNVSTSLWINKCSFTGIFQTAVFVGANGDYHTPATGGFEVTSFDRAINGGPISISKTAFENIGSGAIFAFTSGAVFIDDIRIEEADCNPSLGLIFASSCGTFELKGVECGVTGTRSILKFSYTGALASSICNPAVFCRVDAANCSPLLQNIFTAISSRNDCQLVNGSTTLTRLPTVLTYKANAASQNQGTNAYMQGMIIPNDGGRIWSVSTVGLAPLETVNGSRTNFSFVNGFTPQIPQRLLIDGQMLFGTNANASVNWVWDTTNLHTMTIPTKDVRAFF